MAGPERNTRMLAENPRLIVAFHDHFDPASGGTSDMCLRGLLQTSRPGCCPTPMRMSAGSSNSACFPANEPNASAAS